MKIIDKFHESFNSRSHEDATFFMSYNIEKLHDLNSRARGGASYNRFVVSNQNQPLRVVGLFTSDVFDAPLPIGSEEIKAKAVALLVDLLFQSMAEIRPLRRVNEALKDGLLNPLPEIFTKLRHSA